MRWIRNSMSCSPSRVGLQSHPPPLPLITFLSLHLNMSVYHYLHTLTQPHLTIIVLYMYMNLHPHTSPPSPPLTYPHHLHPLTHSTISIPHTSLPSPPSHPHHLHPSHIPTISTPHTEEEQTECQKERFETLFQQKLALVEERDELVLQIDEERKR